MRTLILACLLALLPQSTLADDAQPAKRAQSLSDIFSEANTAAQRGMLGEAAARYAELLDAGVHDPDVYFNLATALAQSGDYPGAILNYERALVLDPGDRKAAENLRNAEQALEEARAEVEGEASIRRNNSIGDAMYKWQGENDLALALLLSNLLLFAVLGWAWIRRRRGRLFYALLITSAVVLLFSSLGLAVKSGLLRDGPLAVVLGDRVDLLEGPDPRASVRGEARGGDRAVLVGKDGDFVKLRVINGPEGWLSQSLVGAVTPEVRAD